MPPIARFQLGCLIAEGLAWADGVVDDTEAVDFHVQDVTVGDEAATKCKGRKALALSHRLMAEMPVTNIVAAQSMPIPGVR
jgi:hypothetical protein